MSPETHFLMSWIVAAKTTNNPRDCRLVTLAGVLPDVDGLGLLLDGMNQALWHRRSFFYEHYHHLLLHGIFGAGLISLLLAAFARQRWRVAWVSFFLVHLHLLCDFVGSRGPSPEDLWPIFYFGPWNKNSMWIWKGQWRLDGWQNKIVSVGCFLGSLWIATEVGHSFVGVFSRRADRVFVQVLCQWRNKMLPRNPSPIPISPAP